MADQPVDTLGIDASGYIAVIQQVNALNEKYNRIVQGMIGATQKAGSSLNDLTIKFSVADSSGNKLNGTLANLEDQGFQAVSQSISLATKNLEDNTQALTEGEKATVAFNAAKREETTILARLAEIERVRASISGRTDQGAVNVRSSLRSEEAILQPRLAAAQATLGPESQAAKDLAKALSSSNTEYERLSAKIAESRLQSTFKAGEEAIKADEEALRLMGERMEADRLAMEKLNAVMTETRVNRELAERNRLLEEQQAVAQEAANKQTAAALSSGLRERFVPQVSANIPQINAAISQITDTVNSGAVTVQRAMEVINQAQANEAAVFEGAEAQVASSIRRVIALTQSGSDETLKARQVTLSYNDAIAQETAALSQLAEIERIRSTLSIMDPRHHPVLASLGAQEDEARARLGRAQDVLGAQSKEAQEAIRLANERAAAERKLSDVILGSRIQTEFEEQARRQQILIEQVKERAVLERRAQATTLGQQLQQRFVPVQPEKMPQVGTAIGQITDAVNRGTISMERALQVISAVENREAAVFEGASARVAASAGRLIALSNANIAASSAGMSQLEFRTRALIDSFKETERVGVGASTRLFLSWDQLFRLFVIQTAHTLLRKFFNELRVTLTEAREFQTKVAEIRTISQDAQQTTEQWATQLRNLSSAFGVPILDVAEGAYQAISNQIAKGAETALFMRQALEFAKATVSTTADSVNLLSSALNSFHLNVNQTQRISAVLFKTIELGRVRASEMADTFGRVGALASPVGVSLEEVGAAIATLTRNGIKFNEASTLITNVLIRLLKPSAEMEELFKKWGVSSGPEAVLAFGGLAGVMDQIEKATRGSTNELADLFKNIRAVRGAVDLTSGALSGFGGDLKAISTGQEAFAHAVEETLATPAQQLAIQFQKIRNYFTETFGEKAIDQILSLGRVFGTDLSNSIENLIALMTRAGAAFIAFRGGQIIKGVSVSVGNKVEELAKGADINRGVKIALYEQEANAAARASAAVVAAEAAETEAVAQSSAAYTVAKGEVIAAEAELTAVQQTNAAARDAIRARLVTGRFEDIISARTEAETQVELQTLENNEVAVQARVTAAKIQVNATRTLSVAALEAEAVANRQLAISETATAVAAGEANAAITLTTKRSLGLTAAMETVGGAIANPLIWIPALIYGLFELGKAMYDASHAAEEAFKQQERISEETNAQITKIQDAALAEQSTAFKKHLDDQYRAYENYARGINILVDQALDYQKERLKDSTFYTKEAIRSYISAYEKTTSQIEDVYKASLDLARKYEDERMKIIETYAEKEHDIRMKIAEFRDRMATPGKTTRLFDQNQLVETQKEIERLQGEFKRLGEENKKLYASKTPAGTPQRREELKKIESNVTQQKHDAEQVSKLQEELFNRRVSIEERQKSTTDQLDQARKNLAEHREQARLAQEKNALDAQKREETDKYNKQAGHLKRNHDLELGQARERHNREMGNIGEAEAANKEAEEHVRQQKQLTDDEKKVADLEAVAAAQKASLDYLPQINSYEERQLEIQKQLAELYEGNAKRQAALADQAKAEADARTKDFESLKATLTEIAELKFNKIEVKSEADVTAALTRFDSLITKAQSYGLQSQDVINRLAEERANYVNTLRTSLAEYDQKSRSAQLLRIRDETTARIEAAKKVLDVQTKAVLAALETPLKLVGQPEVKEGKPTGKFEPGELATLQPSPILKIGTTLLGPNAELLKDISEVIDRMRQAALQFQLTGKAIDPALVTEYNKKIRNLVEVIAIRKQEQGFDPNQIILRTEYDKFGKVIKEINLQDQLNELIALGSRFAYLTAQQKEARGKVVEGEKTVEDTQIAMGALDSGLSALEQGTRLAERGFKDLAKELTDVIGQMATLKALIARLGPPPGYVAPAPTEAKATGGMIQGRIGYDAIIARVTRGEYIVNERSTKKHWTLLEAINRDQVPGFIEGGSVSFGSRDRPRPVNMDHRATYSEQLWSFNRDQTSGFTANNLVANETRKAFDIFGKQLRSFNSSHDETRGDYSSIESKQNRFIEYTLKSNILERFIRRMLEEKKGYVTGGVITGKPGPDAIIARVSRGEYIVNERSTKKHLALIEAINRDDLTGIRLPGFALGGLVTIQSFTQLRDNAIRQHLLDVIQNQSTEIIRKAKKVSNTQDMISDEVHRTRAIIANDVSEITNQVAVEDIHQMVKELATVIMAEKRDQITGLNRKTMESVIDNKVAEARTRLDLIELKANYGPPEEIIDIAIGAINGAIIAIGAATKKKKKEEGSEPKDDHEEKRTRIVIEDIIKRTTTGIIQHETDRMVRQSLDQIAEHTREFIIDFSKKGSVTEEDILKRVKGYAQGGLVEGPAGIDAILARLSAGEYVIDANTVNKLHRDFTPVFHAKAPSLSDYSVTSGDTFHFGDFHFHGPFSQDKQIAVQEMGRQLQDAIRRGVVSLKPKGEV